MTSLLEEFTGENVGHRMTANLVSLTWEIIVLIFWALTLNQLNVLSETSSWSPETANTYLLSCLPSPLLWADRTNRSKHPQSPDVATNSFWQAEFTVSYFQITRVKPSRYEMFFSPLARGGWRKGVWGITRDFSHTFEQTQFSLFLLHFLIRVVPLRKRDFRTRAILSPPLEFLLGNWTIKIIQAHLRW